jgi:hypothetical protein
MANIQLRVWAEFAELPEVVDAIDDNVSPRFTTWLEPPAALALLAAPAAIACEGLGEDESSGAVGEIDEVSCAGGT